MQAVKQILNLFIYTSDKCRKKSYTQTNHPAEIISKKRQQQQPNNVTTKQNVIFGFYFTVRVPQMHLKMLARLMMHRTAHPKMNFIFCDLSIKDKFRQLRRRFAKREREKRCVY